MQKTNNYNQTPLYFGSKRLLEKLGVSNLPTNFIVRKGDRQLKNKKNSIRRSSSKYITSPKVDLFKD